MRKIALGFLVAASFTAQAQAAGFAIREQSAEGLGQAFAGMGAGSDGLSSMFWNPATISQHNAQGYVSESNFSLIAPTSRAKNGVGVGGSPDSGNIGELGFVPASYSVYGLTDDITLGLAITAPFGLGTKTDTWAGSPHGSKSEMQTINVNPNIAWKVNDMLTVAAGVQGEYMKVKLESASPLGPTFFAGKADDIAFGFTAGLLFEPMDGTDIGIGFRSSITHKLEGTGTLLPIGFLGGDISAGLKTPEIVTLGIRQDITDNMRIMAGAEWANWSRFKTLEIKRDDTGAVIGSTTEKWKDSWFVSLGGEYDLNDDWTLRAGAAYEDSGVPDATRTPRIPDNNRIWLSAGASWKPVDWITANLGYAHVFVDDGTVNLAGGGGLPPLSATFKQHIDIVSASATIDW